MNLIFVEKFKRKIEKKEEKIERNVGLCWVLWSKI